MSSSSSSPSGTGQNVVLAAVPSPAGVNDARLASPHPAGVYSALIARPAATLILVRDTPDGIETCLLRRTAQAAFLAGAHVFPGGAVADGDHDPRTHALCACDDQEASRMFGVEHGGLAWLVAAIRECFEECGLLLACDESGEWPVIDDAASVAVHAAIRGRLAAGALDFADFCRSRGLRLAVDRLAWFSHWITPPGAPRRFDTRFVVAAAPPRQLSAHDGAEVVDHVWIRPAEALERVRCGELRTVLATTTTLESLAHFATTAELMAYARTPRDIPALQPRVAIGREGRRVLIEGDAAYAEVCRLDPGGSGRASCEIVPGVVTALSLFVRRLTAPNASVFTGPGTNSYLLGEGDDLAVVDPGPALTEHLGALLDAAGGRVRRILVTHAHVDHAPAAWALKAATGAEVLGLPSAGDGFVPDRVLCPGERLSIGECTLRVLHTPGHASSHLCYLLEDERLLFSGDHLMQGSTVVINPPDGDMRAYLDSLRALRGEAFDWIAPGHGFLMDRPHERIDRLLDHRMRREAGVLAALAEVDAAALESLLPRVYADVPQSHYGLAARSLLAHLLKLEQDGHVARCDGHWRLERAS